jgi:hypothetical protein
MKDFRDVHGGAVAPATAVVMTVAERHRQIFYKITAVAVRQRQAF